MHELVDLSRVSFDAEAARRAGRRLYMCRHEGRSRDVTLENIAARHDLDVQHQEKYHVRWLTYYVDMQGGTSFCLAEAPSSEAIEICHREAHGSLPHKVVEVDWVSVETFLGYLAMPGPGQRWGENPLRTVLTTEIADLSALITRFGDTTALAVLRQYERVVRGEFAASGGRETQGNRGRLIACFTSATRAIGCAMAIQRTLAERDTIGSGVTVKARIGVSAGEPVTEEDEFFGAAVQLSARMAEVASPGTILVSGVVHDLCIGKKFDFVDRGLRDLDGFAGVHLYQVLPPSKLLEPHRTSPYPDSLTQREIEVLRLLATGKSNQQIAGSLVISQNTVARHVANILGKTNAANRTEAAAYAYRERLL